MPQISHYKLDKAIEEEIYKQFWSSIAKINDIPKASQFFSDLLTETEKVMLSKRLAAAILMVRGRSATDIKKSIHITYSTIGTIAAWVKNAKPKTGEVLMEFSKEKDWETIIDKIDSLLDKLPPVYGTDWSNVGKKKWQRAGERFARKSLR
jgi:uncharacterized protein YerC